MTNYFPRDISNHIVNHFTIFSTPNSWQDNSLIEETILRLVNNNRNNMLTSMASTEEIIKVVFSLNNGSSIGPDYFLDHLYQTYLETIHLDVCNAVTNFFSTNKVLPNFNSNTIVLIPKTSDVDSTS